MASKASENPSTGLSEPRPSEEGPKSYLDLINECDNFPYYEFDKEGYLAHIDTYYSLHIADLPSTALGYMLPSFIDQLRGFQDWQIEDGERKIILLAGSNEAERSKAVASTTDAMRKTDHFAVLRGWRDELYPVYGPNGELLFSMERAASALFGIVTYGCHMTAFTRPKGAKGSDGMKIWVPRRAATKSTYASMLDNTVAGGIATGETPFESMVRESQEEASLAEDLVRSNVRAAGTVTYFHIRDHRAGGQTGLLQPECQYVYDLELAEDIIPKPSDDEVEGFELKSVAEVKESLNNAEFKPNCALVLLDFFVRHGISTAADDGYIEMIARLHRRLPFPTI